jgi:hypothetical protein
MFPFTFMCTQCLCCIHPPSPYPQLFSTPASTNTAPRTCSVLLFYNFVQEKKRKKMTLLFVYNTYTGCSLWHFHIYMYYSWKWFISIFLLSSLVPFLWWFQQILKFYIHSCIGNTSTIFTLLISSLNLPLSHVTSP